jgi:hypothetical protein
LDGVAADDAARVRPSAEIIVARVRELPASMARIAQSGPPPNDYASGLNRENAGKVHALTS